MNSLKVTLAFGLVLLNVNLDFPVGALFFWGIGIVSLLILSILIIFIEALILKSLNYGSWRQSFISSFMMNVTSGVVGYIVASLADEVGLSNYLHIGYVFAGLLFMQSAEFPGILATLFFLIFSFVSSVISEGFVLMFFRREHFVPTIWRMNIMTNSLGYILLITLYLVAFVILKGIL